MMWWPWLHPKLIGNWPKEPTLLGRRHALFNHPAAPLRPMIVVVDALLLARAAHDEKVKYLLELLTENPIQAHLYAGSGAPKDSQLVIAVDTGVEGIRDWVVTAAGDSGEHLDVIYLKDGVPTLTPTDAGHPYIPHLFESFKSTDDPSGDRRAQARADALGLLVAKAIRADLFVTDRPLLVDGESEFWRGLTVMPPDTALPVVGLYLRQQEKFVLHRSPALGSPDALLRLTERNQTWFYWQAAQGLIPGRDRWAYACAAYTRAANDTTLSSLPQALIWRLDQVLRARDRLLATLAVVPQDYSPVDEALTELDQILLWLMAAFDIAARVAHVALDVPMKIRNAAWQSEEWLNKLANQDTALANLVRNNSEGEHILTIVKELRNSVHGDALSAGGMIPVAGKHALEPLVALPQSSREHVLEAIDALGGQEVWGVVQPFPEKDLHFHPGTFVEQLLPRTLNVLNALMDATSVERLLGAESDPERVPGTLPRMLHDHRMMWQLGLE
jgi:hypothetical protein